MKILLLIIPLVTAVAASGYYYQERSSHSSSSSYKNNELQHQTEDESYYSKRGDTEGRNSPKVNTYSQHLEYKNPNRDQDHITNLDQNRHTEESDAYAARQAVGADGIVRSVSGNRDQYSYHATYGTSSGDIAALRGGTYDTQSHLLSLTQRLQDDLSRQLQNAITTQKSYGSSSYNTYVESDFRSLESELKSNLSRQLQEELQRHYGNQVNRGSHSYSIQNGRDSTQANYNTQELEDLRGQLERNLMQQLRNQYNTQSSSSRSSSSSTYYSSQNQQQTGQNFDQTPRAHQTMYRPTYPSADSFPVSPEVRPAIPLTDVLTQVQTAVDRNLNEALNQVAYEYITGETVNYQDAPNFDRILDDLKEDLRRNLTNTLQTTLTEHYGQQEEHNNYYYTSRHVASGSRIANYKVDDLESLKQQVLNNLIQKLGNTIQQHRQSYQTNRQSYYQRRQTQESSGSSYTGYQPTPTNKVYTSYVVFQPSSTGDLNTRPAYRPTQTINNEGQQPIRYRTPQKPQNGPITGVYQTSGSGSSPSGGRYEPTETRLTTGSGSQTSDSNYYTTGTIHYPSGGNNQPSSSNTYPSNGNTYPSSSNTYPSNGNTYPSSGNTYTSSGNTYTPNNNNYPSSSRTYPSGGGGSNYQQSNYQTSQSRESSYRAAAGHGEAGIEHIQGSNRPQTDYQAELIDIRDQVQTDLTRQVNSAIEKQRQASTSYSTTSTSSNQVLADLSEELKRNLTQKIEQTLAEHSRRHGNTGGYSVTFSTSGNINPGNYNREQLTSMMSQLQNDLLRQLREGLAQDAYRQSSSFSSSGTSYEPIMSHGSYGVGSNAYRTSYSSGSSYRQRQQYSSGNECCIQADDSTTVSQVTVDQKKHRGDLEESNESKNSEIADIEPVPDENVETSTRTLARDKPSTKPKVTASISSQQAPESADLSQQQNLDQTDNADQDQLTQQETLGQFNQNIENVGQVFEDDDTSRITQESVQQQNSGRTYQNTYHSGRYNNLFTQQNEFLTHERDIPERYQSNPVQKVHELLQQNLTKLKDNLDQHSYIFDLDQSSDLTDDSRPDFDQLTQQTDDLTQQNEDLTQQNVDLTQNTYRSTRPLDTSSYSDKFTQQTDDLTQQNEDLTQQNEDLTQQNEDLTQQSSSQTQQTQNLAQQLDLTQNTYRSTRPVYPSSYSHRFTQQTDDLTQQSDDLTQQNEDLTQQNEDLTQQSYYSSQTQQTQNIAQKLEDLTLDTYRSQRPAPISPYAHTLTQQTEDLTQQTEDLTQQSEDLTQQSEDLTQQSEDLTQQYQSHIDDSQTPQRTSSYLSNYRTASRDQYSESSGSQIRQFHQATVQEIPEEQLTDLDQQHVEQQVADVVQDVTHQVHQEQPQKFEDVEEITTTPKPGFWKNVGSKISSTYSKAKSSITALG